MNKISKYGFTINNNGDAFISISQVSMLCNVQIDEVMSIINEKNFLDLDEDDQLTSKGAFFVISEIATKDNNKALRVLIDIGSAGMAHFIYNALDYKPWETTENNKEV